MLEGLIFTLLGLFLSLLVPAVLVYFQTRNNRKLYGDWYIAFQAAYYEDNEWHKQKVTLKFSLLGVRLVTASEQGKLDWAASLSMTDDSFLLGKWWSIRPGSKSHGQMCLQFSPNGKYLWGHIYGQPNSNRTAKVGRFLMARSEEDVEQCWKALLAGEKEFLNLAEETQYQ